MILCQTKSKFAGPNSCDSSQCEFKNETFGNDFSDIFLQMQGKGKCLMEPSKSFRWYLQVLYNCFLPTADMKVKIKSTCKYVERNGKTYCNVADLHGNFKELHKSFFVSFEI